MMQNLYAKATDVDGTGTQRHLSTDNQQAVPRTEVPGAEVPDISSSLSNKGPPSGMVGQTASRSSSEVIPKMSDLVVSTATSPCDVSVGAVSAELDEMEIDGVAGARADNNKFWNESLPPREEIPSLNPTHSYPTPQSNPPETPIPEKRRIEYSKNFPSKTVQREVLSSCSPASPTDGSAGANIGSASEASKSVSTGYKHPSVEDDMGDEEMESILEDAYKFLKYRSVLPNSNSETEPSTPRVRESPEDSHPGDEYVTDTAVSELARASVLSPSSPANEASPAPRQTDDHVGVAGNSKNRKRKRTPETDDPTARRASQNSTLSNGSIQAAALQSSLLVADDEDLAISDALSSLGSSSAGSPLLEPDHSPTPEPTPWT
ncbi:hypothetical protein N7539_008657 [Penicillium diatomitis]|uniref:Uncharacterized protein n=1 Tax=Penicillium diatomitis TaxID=2819901 RepID=A0A9X0BM51_9EURO|nr:uncharacterized protein N7539_008657 [Penicillium diatomitis]KAJ5472088.1 hypothetical protein N7539_008657 [Penicillium diatomitis]